MTWQHLLLSYQLSLKLLTWNLKINTILWIKGTLWQSCMEMTKDRLMKVLLNTLKKRKLITKLIKYRMLRFYPMLLLSNLMITVAYFKGEICWVKVNHPLASIDPNIQINSSNISLEIVNKVSILLCKWTTTTQNRDQIPMTPCSTISSTSASLVETLEESLNR